MRLVIYCGWFFPSVELVLSLRHLSRRWSQEGLFMWFKPRECWSALAGWFVVLAAELNFSTHSVLWSEEADLGTKFAIPCVLFLFLIKLCFYFFPQTLSPLCTYVFFRVRVHFWECFVTITGRASEIRTIKSRQMINALRGRVKRIIFISFNNGTIRNKTNRLRKDKSSQIAFFTFLIRLQNKQMKGKWYNTCILVNLLIPSCQSIHN